MPHPLLLEINTRCWLREWSIRLGRDLHLGSVPVDDIQHWQRLGFTHVWLMGVWKSGTRSRQHALEQPDLRKSFHEALPDWKEVDVTGSPYAIGDYRVARSLGGESGLRRFRQRLREHGLRLILDFVPNHLGHDHAWLDERPELFVQSPRPAPHTFGRRSGNAPRWFAYGKDPYFPPWSDTVQLDYRRAETRAAMIQVLQAVSAWCDGVRCDMAMLLLSEIFREVWREFPCPAPPPPTEFWSEAIASIRESTPDFLFLAEAYWGLEERLLGLGFDYAYDKKLYDHLVARNRGDLRRHLAQSSPRGLASSTHFLENHDEPRAAAVFALEEHRAAALLTLGLPGMRLVHDGQMSGARIRTPVHLGRRSLEATQPEIRDYYEKVLTALPATAIGCGQAEILRTTPAWEGNPTDQNFVVVWWQKSELAFDLVIVNLAPHRSQCYVALPPKGLTGWNWRMSDLLGTEIYERPGRELIEKGLYLDLAGHAAQLLQFRPIA